MSLLTKDGLRARSKRGGKRRGSGRPPKGARAGAPHKKRQDFAPNTPLHVVLRVDHELGTMRTETMYEAVRKATAVVARRTDMRINQLSIQGTHHHLIVEAQNKAALAAGMKAFQVSAAKHINRAATSPGAERRKGRVFSDRYHVEILDTPRRVRHALAYVLNNWRKHGEDREPSTSRWKVDRFSSGVSFDGWTERQGRAWKAPVDYRPLVVRPPVSWLLRVGWRKHGLISFEEVPGARPRK